MKPIDTNEKCGLSEAVISNLPKVLIAVFQEQHVFDKAGKRVPLHSNVSLPEVTTLYHIVRHLKPSISAEVGFAQGVSTLGILQALQDNNNGTHHVMDPFQEQYGDAGLAMVERACLSSRMQFHRQFADEVIPRLPSLEFGFIDSSHLFDLTVCEFILMDRKLKIGGMLAFHDTWMASLQKFLRYVIANRSYELVRTFDSLEAVNPRNSKQAIKEVILRALRFVPGRGRIFREELLSPWQTWRVRNLVVLRKTASDERDWKFHQPF